jgi:DNA-binding transcriptional regulator YhcF (GntR family)
MVEGFQVQRTGGKAIYLQIYEHIVDQMRGRMLEPGNQLPTETRLSKDLKISRNTVSMAYQRLERDGFVESTPGRGTFVTHGASATSAPAASKKDRIARLLDLAIEEALALGISLDDYSALFKRHLAKQRKKIRTSRICFIECNDEQLMIFADDIRKELGISITPILLDDFRNRMPAPLKLLREADIILTSVYHSSEVVSLLPDRRIDVVGLQPELDSLIKIAQFPPHSKVGLICGSKQFQGDILNTLRDAKLSLPNFSVVATEDIEKLAKRFAVLDAAIVSPGRLQDVESINHNKIPVIEFVYRLSAASMSLIKTLIIENQRRSDASRHSSRSKTQGDTHESR